MLKFQAFAASAILAKLNLRRFQRIRASFPAF